VSRYSLGRVLVAVVVALTAVITGQPASAEVAMAPPKIPTHGYLFGTSVESQGSFSYQGELADVESRLGRTVALDRTFARWDDGEPTALVTDDLSDGRVPLLSISARKRDGTKLAWSAIAAGAFDGDIRRQADALRDTGRPLLLAFAHEADILTGYGEPTDFRAAFRHYVTVFRAERASNVGFVLILTPHSYTDAADWYPGAGYVDWLGADAYNFGSCKPSVSGWHSLQYAAQPFYDWASKQGKPLVLAEFGAPPDPNDPGRRAQWLRDAATTLSAWTAIKAAVYYDRNDTCDWRVDDDAASFSALRSIARSPSANGRPTAGIVPVTAAGSAPLATAFVLARSTGGESATGKGIVAWTVDFGDGTATQTGTGQPNRVSHTYRAGTWTAKLTVTDGAGRIASATATILARRA
jgi:PKD domain/Glycosyl hydrolase family 26